MQVDSDNGYMGDYNYKAYYPSYGGDLGMLEAVTPTLREGDTYALSRGTKQGRSSTQPAISTAARSVKFNIDAALHEAMKYKPPTTSNKFAALASLEDEEI